jgi:[protein-PII] uridylyltransferase
MPTTTPAPTTHQVVIPGTPHLDAALAGWRTSPRADLVAGVRALRTEELARIRAHQTEHIGEATGLDTATAITAMTDAMVRTLAHWAFAKAGAPADWSTAAGVIAVGGYGRGEMNPQSDLDLLVLLDDRAPAWAEAGWTELNTLLWDVKFQVGASRRTLPELGRIIDEDFVTATALIEQRPLIAGPRLTTALSERLERLRTKRATPFLRYKLDELAKRRSQAGASLFLMEPHLKSNPGCLRDVQLLRTIAFIACGARNLIALSELEGISRADLAGVVATNDHLLGLRSLLHFQHGRKQDVFTLPDQVLTAKLQGYADVSRLRAVEHFMKRHYAQVLHVHQVLDLAISRIEARGLLGRRPLLILSRTVIDQNFTAIGGKLYLVGDGLWRTSDAVLRLFRAARQCQQRGLRFSYELQRQIRDHLALVDDACRRDRAIALVFLEILRDLGRVRPPLDDLHRAGLLGAWLPEFGKLTCHMQFDSYHQYTVDEHSLIAIGNLDAVFAGTASGAPGMARLLPGLARRDLLALSLLLHDMGKYMGRGHVARGAMMVALVAERLGLDDAEEDLVFFLVDRHVSLSDASRMRDFHEPSFLRSFAERMGTRERLDYLYCLTWCDARAVGEGILTGWQEALLAELHQAVAEQLATGGAQVADHQQRLLGALAAGGVTPAAAQAFLTGLPHAYLHAAQPGDVLRHQTVVARCRGGDVGLAWELGERFQTVAAALRDRHGLLADVAAAISGNGFDIIGARTWITDDGIVLYHLRLAGLAPARLTEATTWSRLHKDLAEAAAGTLDAGAQLTRRTRAYAVTKAADAGFDDPAVKIEHQSSEHWSIIDVHCKDEPGLLWKLCRTISDHGLEIGHTCITTMGDVAVDVFYVQRNGAKLSTADGDALRQRIVASLGLRRDG